MHPEQAGVLLPMNVGDMMQTRAPRIGMHNGGGCLTAGASTNFVIGYVYIAKDEN